MRHLLLALTLIGLASPASAALFDRGNGMIYDDVLGITWLQDANYAMTSGFDANGLMTWNDSVAWADSLMFGGFDDWRLPLMDLNLDGNIVRCDVVVSEADCRDNEFGYMFYYNLMGSIFDDLTGDQGFFTNIQDDYWSGTEGSISNVAWAFWFDNGISAAGSLVIVYGAWAVRDGDVGAVVPIPAAFWLFGSALAGLVCVRRVAGT